MNGMFHQFYRFTVFLKADNGADVNVMNAKTFDSIFGNRKVLETTPLRMILFPMIRAL